MFSSYVLQHIIFVEKIPPGHLTNTWNIIDNFVRNGGFNYSLLNSVHNFDNTLFSRR